MPAGRQQVLDALPLIENKLEVWFSYLEWNSSAETRQAFMMMFYFYIFWISAHQIVETHLIMLVIGTLGITWWSPYMTLLRKYFQRTLLHSILTTVFIGPVRLGQRGPLLQWAEEYRQKAVQGHSQHDTFAFVLYENQRLTPFGQWDAPLSFDRAPWSDEASETIQPKSRFTLPAPLEIVVSDPQRHDYGWKRIWTWIWVDHDWRLDLDSDVDDLGWEYGTASWDLFDGKPKGWMSTRRRRWIRLAKLDYRVEVPPQSQQWETGDQIQTVSHATNLLEPAKSGAASLLLKLARNDSQDHLTSPTSALSSTVFSEDELTSPSVNTSRPSIISVEEKPAPRRSQSTGLPPTSPTHSSVSVNSAIDGWRSRTSSAKRRQSERRSSTGQKKREAVWKSIVVSRT
ncbi:peroxisome- protein [Apophysomyces ossiformis]|uniref:Peroxisome- protein n=1 Tax=Apophysomyces ossiformis TaxID=679940 RepID=A0A8H7ENS1_9FUNG|nr:peroxisome- protein [Apophysomyces ossiformis]